MTPARYYQVLSRLIDEPAAMAYDALLVRRMQRLRDSRRHQRSSARLDAV